MLPDVKDWAVIHTHSRCEKVIADFLSENNIRYYLPLYKKRRRYGRHIRESMLPLFPGYLFYDYEAISRPLLYKTHKIARIIVVEDKERLHKELENIDRALSSGELFDRADFKTPGRSVVVVEGPLKGVEGEILKKKNHTKLIIKIHILGMAVETDIDEAYVKLL
ncbi:MAG: transcription termination/antitermination NusG family protein [Myxococcota bacterium]